MDAAVNQGQYDVVIDMSWAFLSSTMKKLLYKQLSAMWSHLSRKYVIFFS